MYVFLFVHLLACFCLFLFLFVFVCFWLFLVVLLTYLVDTTQAYLCIAKTIVVSSPYKEHFKYYAKYEDLAGMQTHHDALPMSSSLPSIDAVTLNPPLFLQMTVRLKHSVVANEILQFLAVIPTAVCREYNK
jgi:hypothetical protein